MKEWRFKRYLDALNSLEDRLEIVAVLAFCLVFLEQRNEVNSREEQGTRN